MLLFISLFLIYSRRNNKLHRGYLPEEDNYTNFEPYVGCKYSKCGDDLYLYYRRRRGKMEDNQIIELYRQRNEEAIKETQAKYGSYC